MKCSQGVCLDSVWIFISAYVMYICCQRCVIFKGWVVRCLELGIRRPSGQYLLPVVVHFFCSCCQVISSKMHSCLVNEGQLGVTCSWHKVFVLTDQQVLVWLPVCLMLLVGMLQLAPKRCRCGKFCCCCKNTSPSGTSRTGRIISSVEV